MLQLGIFEMHPTVLEIVILFTLGSLLSNTGNMGVSDSTTNQIIVGISTCNWGQGSTLEIKS